MTMLPPYLTPFVQAADAGVAESKTAPIAPSWKTAGTLKLSLLVIDIHSRVVGIGATIAQQSRAVVRITDKSAMEWATLESECA
jgi:hypothetical protein